MESEKRQCYWLRELEPEPNHPDRFRVCVVTEDEPGYQPTGHGKGDAEVVPWYWDEVTCEQMNRERFGLEPEEVNKIVVSSMFYHGPKTAANR